MNFRNFPRRMSLALSMLLMATSALAAPVSYRLHVDGLACPFCAYGIEKKLSAVRGVNRVETDIKAGVVVVTMQEAAALDEADAKRAVQKAGFTLKGFEPVPAKK